MKVVNNVGRVTQESGSAYNVQREHCDELRGLA